MLARCIRDAGETVPGQIDEALPVPQAEKVDELRPAWRFAGPRELPPVDNNIDRARLAGVRAPGDGHLDTTVGHKLLRRVGARNKSGFRVLRHGVCPQDSVYNLGLLV